METQVASAISPVYIDLLREYLTYKEWKLSPALEYGTPFSR